MALATSINMVVQDGKGSKSLVSFYVPSDTALADMTEIAQEFADRLDAVMDGAIVGISASYNVALPAGIKANPVATADVEEGALYLWNTDGGFNTRFRVPTHSEDKILAGSRVVDTTDTDVAALVSIMTAGFTATSTNLIEPCDYREDDVAALDVAYESFKASKGRP